MFGLWIYVSSAITLDIKLDVSMYWGQFLRVPAVLLQMSKLYPPHLLFPARRGECVVGSFKRLVFLYKL